MYFQFQFLKKSAVKFISFLQKDFTAAFHFRCSSVELLDVENVGVSVDIALHKYTSIVYKFEFYVLIYK